jgi:hypothetical protein
MVGPSRDQQPARNAAHDPNARDWVLIIFNDYLVRHLRLSEIFVWYGGSLYRLYLLYFGLTLVGLASLIYQFRCPDLLKAHGSAWEFAATEGATMSSARLQWLRKQVVTARNASAMPSMLGVSFQQFLDMVLNGDRYTKWIKTITDVQLKQQASRFNRHLMTEWNGYSWGDSQAKNDLLTDFFVPQKKIYPYSRYTVLTLYIAGFLILAIPTTEVFISVLIRFAQWVAN